ncbi:hypothetical protein EYZ11_005850 [Aspergillus tanneri]|uniref:Uncharacterized protein n=1 Tax=Aspergillus tanneri TaxID=1220188 RepID=A0A4S3JHH1_9EURO|nr:uncharacterized protein ATNIH1004_004237 [Aspergillus tanneri]KAA8648352.1 hypothetical protein ATNIH1004_004237 [Aspergillus tanneri]THC94665.1 hypothetical protein EYZ11_005850 [Aspergillus tanneri]
MDLSKLTRPAILCQCSRCSSSLAALENDWAKLSNSYSVAAGWLSVELHRISISSERKQIPQSSDLSILRGRILQEIACKLCQQKLGVLCALEIGPSIFWKLSKVSFREIVTMRTVEPSFKDGALEQLMKTTPKESARRDRNSIQQGALVSVGQNAVDLQNGSMEQQLQHQGLSIDHISSSVNNLHDTMSELKHAFTALRIELNGPGRFPNMESSSGGDFNMITTLLKELKLKSDEIERLKLEIEALKLRNRYAEEQTAKQPALILAPPDVLPQVQSPGLLHGSRKRPLPDSFDAGGRTNPIADSFDDDDDDDSIGDFFLEDHAIPPVKVPLKAPKPNHMDGTTNEPAPFDSPNIRIEVSQLRKHPLLSDNDKPNTHPQLHQSPNKRPRLPQSTERPSSSGQVEKRKVGRPRKSTGQTTSPDLSQVTKLTPLSEQNGNAHSVTQPESLPPYPSPSDPSSSKENRRSRSRSLRSRSRPPSMAPSNRRGQNGDSDAQDQAQTLKGSIQTEGQKGSGRKVSSSKSNGENTVESNEKRKAQVATRDAMARLAMQREEALETEAR